MKASHPDGSWRHIINLRHLIAHQYRRVDMDQLWTITIDDIPRLLAALSTHSCSGTGRFGSGVTWADGFAER